MKIKFECVVYYGDNFFVDLELPDDIKFYEFFRYNEKQRFYVTIIKKDDELYEHLTSKMVGRCHRYIFGDYMILELSQCHPVNEDLPLMSLDDLNKLFDKHIKGYYIKSERPSREKTLEKSKNNPNKIELLLDGKPVELDANWIAEQYISMCPIYYTEYIAKPLGFVDRTGQDLCMKFGVIRMYSMFDDGFFHHIHRFEVDIKKLTLFDEDWSHGQKITISNSEEISYEYDKAIENLLEMDNYDYKDYRKE